MPAARRQTPHAPHLYKLYESDQYCFQLSYRRIDARTWACANVVSALAPRSLSLWFIACKRPCATSIRQLMEYYGAFISPAWIYSTTCIFMHAVHCVPRILTPFARIVATPLRCDRLNRIQCQRLAIDLSFHMQLVGAITTRQRIAGLHGTAERCSSPVRGPLAKW